MIFQKYLDFLSHMRSEEGAHGFKRLISGMFMIQAISVFSGIFHLIMVGNRY